MDKLLDNQMRIFSKYKNLSNEKFLIQQFNALNQEMDLLQSHLAKVNQLLNDTIVEKCKHELMHEQHQIQQQVTTSAHRNVPTSNNTSNSSNGTAMQQQQQPQTPEIENKSSLFRASLVPVGSIPIGATTTSAATINGTPTSQSSSDSPSTSTTTTATNHNSSGLSSSSSSAASSHLLHNQMKTLVLSSQQFGNYKKLIN